MAAQVRALGSDVVVIPREAEGKWLFLNPVEPDWLVTNAAGASILSRCDGCATPESIAEAVSVPREQVESYLEQVNCSAKLLEPGHGAVGAAIAGHLEEGRNLSQPMLRSLHLNISPKCNLDCCYCYAASRPATDTAMSVDQWEQVLDCAHGISHRLSVSFTGGEPLLARFCIELAEYSKSLGNSNILLTNGLAITRRNVTRIANAFGLIKVSIDGSSPETHEAHRGPKTFVRTMLSLHLLEKAQANFSVSMTVTRKNINDVRAMTARYGDKLTFQPLFQAGNASSGSDLAISGEEYYEALASVEDVKPLGALDRILASARNARIRKCAIADTEISVASSGDVFPCHMLHEPKFRAGNVLVQDLKEIYLNSPVLRECRALTVETIEGCKFCEIRYICGGSCRARAYFETGNLKSAGNFCEYEKLAFVGGILESSVFV